MIGTPSSKAMVSDDTGLKPWNCESKSTIAPLGLIFQIFCHGNWIVDKAKLAQYYLVLAPKMAGIELWREMNSSSIFTFHSNWNIV